jgi:ATP-dependent helicase HrpB
LQSLKATMKKRRHEAEARKNPETVINPHDMPVEPLPIDAHVARIVALAAAAPRAVVVTAAPGAGKTTRVPPALAVAGRVLLLQPRRVAARSIARRIADEQRWVLGREVGWQMRFDRHFDETTRLLVATEGILTARLQQDPLLTGWRTVVLDEAHERSIHGDLGLALARQAWRARNDLSIVVMSATIDAQAVSAYLDGCPVVSVEGRSHPIEITYRPGTSVEDAVLDLRTREAGAVLCFLPGAGEINAVADRLASRLAASGGPAVDVLPLHGALDADAQDAAVRPSRAPRVILATNIAETTITVPDVTAVVDTGLHKVARYDGDRAIDSLSLERVSQASADQRAGRAGRTRAGAAVRLWDSRDRLRPHREPEIARIDLAATALSVIAWGGDPRTLEWLEPPPPHALDAAMLLLHRLGAIDARGRLTPLGRQIERLPLHPRLARILLAAHGAPVAARACALLSERHFVPSRHLATSCDLLSAVDDPAWLPAHVPRVARDIRDAARGALGEVAAGVDEVHFRRAVLTGYPDRVARRRTRGVDRLLLASGAGARLARESGVVDAEFLVAVDVTAARSSTSSSSRDSRSRSASDADALVRMATSIDRDWLKPTHSDLQHELRDDGEVRAVRREMYDAILLTEQHVDPDPVVAARLLRDELLARGPGDDDRQLLNRLAFAGLDLSFDTLVTRAVEGATRIRDVDLAAHLGRDVRQRLDRDAPAAWRAPGGRDVRLKYDDTGGVSASTRLQDLFGVEDGPRLGPSRVPVTFHLLAPNGRPVQVTRDLRSFWSTAYPEMRKALKARYPKHAW